MLVKKRLTPYIILVIFRAALAARRSARPTASEKAFVSLFRGTFFMDVPVGRPLSRSASDWLLIIYFDGEAEVFDHAPDFGSWCAWSREVPVHKDGVGRVEGKGL